MCDPHIDMESQECIDHLHGAHSQKRCPKTTRGKGKTAEAVMNQTTRGDECLNSGRGEDNWAKGRGKTGAYDLTGPDNGLFF